MESRVFILRLETWAKLIALHLFTGIWAIFCFSQINPKSTAAIITGLTFTIAAAIIAFIVLPEKNRMKALLLFCFLQIFVFGIPMLISATVNFTNPSLIKALNVLHQLAEINYILILIRLCFQGFYMKWKAPVN